jgi:segregation and condensation protein A
MQDIESRHLSTFQRQDTAAARLEEAERPLSDVTMFDLLSAFAEALERAARAAGVHEVEEEEVTVAQQVELILKRLRANKELLFHSLFPEGASRMVMVATFLALLELIRLRKLVAAQERPFAEIKILAR